jgi:hypothetical protein
MCPLCASQNLGIKPMRGLERFMIFLTDKRKYHCRECGHKFRMADRRKQDRGGEGAAIASACAAGILRYWDQSRNR